MKLKSIVFGLILAVVGCMSSAFAQVTYNFETVNYPGDTFTQLLGINNAGLIAGYHGFTTNKGFTYNMSAHTFTSENFPKSAQTQVIGINDLDRTTGFYINTAGSTVGFTMKGGVYTSVAFPGQPFNQLLSQNGEAQAAGYFSTKADGSGPDHAYVYDEVGGVFELFILPNSKTAQATGINDAGNVCGFTVDGANNMHGWLKVLGTITILNFPGAGNQTQALGLNNKGQVVGSYTDSSNNTHGFVYEISTKKWQSIEDPDGPNSTIVNGINDNGVLVGFYGVNPDNSGFIATPQ